MDLAEDFPKNPFHKAMHLVRLDRNVLAAVVLLISRSIRAKDVACAGDECANEVSLLQTEIAIKGGTHADTHLQLGIHEREAPAAKVNSYKWRHYGACNSTEIEWEMNHVKDWMACKNKCSRTEECAFVAYCDPKYDKKNCVDDKLNQCIMFAGELCEPKLDVGFQSFAKVKEDPLREVKFFCPKGWEERTGFRTSSADYVFTANDEEDCLDKATQRDPGIRNLVWSSRSKACWMQHNRIEGEDERFNPDYLRFCDVMYSETERELPEASTKGLWSWAGKSARNRKLVDVIKLDGMNILRALMPGLAGNKDSPLWNFLGNLRLCAKDSLKIDADPESAEFMCEGHCYKMPECLSVGCCRYDQATGMCKSAKGKDSCMVEKKECPVCIKEFEAMQGCFKKLDPESVMSDGCRQHSAAVKRACKEMDAEDKGCKDNGNPCAHPHSGEAMCQGQCYNKQECRNVGCCYWKDEQCWSAVGKEDMCKPYYYEHVGRGICDKGFIIEKSGTTSLGKLECEERCDDTDECKFIAVCDPAKSGEDCTASHKRNKCSLYQGDCTKMLDDPASKGYKIYRKQSWLEKNGLPKGDEKDGSAH